MKTESAGSCLAQGKHFLTVPVFLGLLAGIIIGNFVLPLLQSEPNPPDCTLLFQQSEGRSRPVEPIIHEYHRKNTTRKTVKVSDDARTNLIHVTVKTTESNLDTRLPTLRKTWFTYARVLSRVVKVIIVTDHNLGLSSEENHLATVNSHCPKTHATMDLCCKTQAEFKTYYLREDSPGWFCRFDDDNYVNLDNLITLLRQYNTEKDTIYLGQRSLEHPVGGTYKASDGRKTDVTFEFLNGGSGLCFSKALMEQLKPILYGADGTGSGFTGMCKNMGHADDVLLGYFVTNALQFNWTESNLFTCWQTQDLEALIPENLLEAVTLTYRNKESITNLEAKINVPGFPGIVNAGQDPTRFLSLHKYLQYNGFYSGLKNEKTT